MLKVSSGAPLLQDTYAPCSAASSASSENHPQDITTVACSSQALPQQLLQPSLGDVHAAVPAAAHDSLLLLADRARAAGGLVPVPQQARLQALVRPGGPQDAVGGQGQ